MVLDDCEICGDDPELKEQSDRWREADLKPEYIQYKDEGCEHAPSCLSCPFPRCLYEGAGVRQYRRKKLRNREIRDLYKSGRKPKELIRVFEVSERTIYRAIKGNYKRLKKKRKYSRRKKR